MHACMEPWGPKPIWLNPTHPCLAQTWIATAIAANCQQEIGEEAWRRKVGMGLDGSTPDWSNLEDVNGGFWLMEEAENFPI